MKILISTDTYYPQVNGASYFTQRLAYNLQAHGHEVRVVAPGETLSNTDTIINTVRVHGVYSFPVLFYPKFRFSFLLWKSRSIEKIFDDFQPDIVHLQGHFFISRVVLSIARKRNIPVVATNHFMPENLVHYLPFSSVIGPPIKDLAWKDFSRIFNRVGNISTPTSIAAALIQPHFKKHIQAISCGIDLSIFKPQNNGAYLKEKYSLRSKPVLLYVGRLDKEKNIDMILRSLSKIQGDIRPQFIIAGIGAEKNNLVELARDLGISEDVIFAGFVPDADLPNLYAIADCFIIAGIAELQSIVTMEAMATGLPVLAVNAVALPELVKDGQNGYLFEFGNVDALSEKIARLFTSPVLRKEMGRRSLELIKTHSIENSIAKFEELYTNEMAKYHHPATPTGK